MAYRILCIAADPDRAEGYGRMLADPAYEVMVVGAGDWNKQLAEDPPVVIVSELELHGTDGLQVLEEASRLLPGAQRVLAAADADLELLEGALAAGTVHFVIQLPGRAETLQTVIESALERRLRQDKQEAVGELLKRQNQELESMARQFESMVDRRTRQIERAKKEWERTFDAIVDPLVQVGGDFRLRRVNVAAARHAEQDVRKLPNQTCYSALFGQEAPCAGCPVAGGVAAWPGPGAAEAEVADARHGKTFQLAAFLFDAEPSDPRFVCHYRDVTRERRLQQQIRQSEKLAAVGTLSGGIAHELNNPIGVILSFVQLSRMSPALAGDEELADNLQEIEKAANRCKKIVEELLQFSRPSIDRQMAPVRINEPLDSALFLVSTQRKIREVEVRRNLAEGLPMVLGNSNQLAQVFINLVQNAVQAMGKGGILSLETGLRDGMVYASVSDTGEGISPENLKRLFEPFFTTKAPGQGTGLGLSVSYGIVERHGGRVEVSSKEGEGSTFTVLLPPAPTDESGGGQ